jgi:hypothetical protein
MDQIIQIIPRALIQRGRRRHSRRRMVAESSLPDARGRDRRPSWSSSVVVIVVYS